MAAGSRLRERARAPAALFGAVGLALVAGSFAVPDYGELLFAWGGTALFVALLLRVVLTGTTVPAAVATDIQTATGGTARRLAGEAPRRYVPDGDEVTLVVGDRTFDPVGARLLAGVETTGADGDRLAELVDVAVNDLELAASAKARVTESGATVTVTDSRVGTGELFDHPVVSLFGVGLADHLGTPVTVGATVEATFGGDRLVVTCEWSEGAEELLDGS